MFRIKKQITFKASHKLYNGGRENEEDHFHNWTISVALDSPILNEFGFVYDYIILEKYLVDIADPIKNNSFNNISYFQKTNPTAENIAKYFSDKLQQKLFNDRGYHIKIVSVEVLKEKDSAIYFVE